MNLDQICLMLTVKSDMWVELMVNILVHLILG